MFLLPENITKIIEKLEASGFEGYIVGGCVRDMLLGLKPYDFDITTSATPEEIIALFPKTVPTGIKHGTVTVLIDSLSAEVTTFRTEGGYRDHRRPDEVHFVRSVEEDLSRRDFTVNAMVYSPKRGIFDPFGGRLDLEAKLLRAVGDPETRFNEDALRILRLFRFSSTLGFSIEENTLAAALKCAPLLEGISRERIFAELQKAVCGKNTAALDPLCQIGALFFLGVTTAPDFKALDRLPPKPFLRLFAFLYLSKADTAKALKELKASNALCSYSAKLCSLFSLSFPETSADIKRFLAKTDKETVEDYFHLSNALGKDTAKALIMLNEILDRREPYLISHLEIDGERLKELGFKGHEIGKILQSLSELVIEQPQLNKEELLIKEISRT